MFALRRCLRPFQVRPVFYYSKSHEYLDYNAETKSAKLGLTTFAQTQLGDIVHLDLPDVGKKMQQGQILGVVESVKTVADIYAPVSGVILSVNEILKKQPEVVNTDPETKGWVAEISVEKVEELNSLLSLEAYQKVCAQEHH